MSLESRHVSPSTFAKGGRSNPAGILSLPLNRCGLLAAALPRAAALAAGLAALAASACSSGSEAVLSLDPVPFELRVPGGIAPRLGGGPVEGPFGDRVREEGGLAAVTVYYRPVEQGERVIFMSVYWFPAEKFDALRSPDEPPLFGSEVLRKDGKVLSVVGPFDAIYPPDTPDGRNLAALDGVIYLPESYREAD